MSVPDFVEQPELAAVLLVYLGNAFPVLHACADAELPDIEIDLAETIAISKSLYRLGHVSFENMSHQPLSTFL